jgi:signal transduction histidine kinase
MALTLAALHDGAPATERPALLGRLEQELQRFEVWAENCPENFFNRYALVSAEVARIENRPLEAEQWYERAIRSARENGFVQNEGLAYELASHFYRDRGYGLFADAYLREACTCYRRWGAEGKARQLEQRYPQPTERRPVAATSTFAARTDEMDLLSVIKASQAISSELVLDQLVRTLVKTAVEHSAARKGCLVLVHDDELVVTAAAVQKGGSIVAEIASPVPIDSSIAPVSVVQYVRMTKARVIVDDAEVAPKRFAADEYLARVKPRSFLCLPILKQAGVRGLLYLENDLVAGAFTPDRLAALELLASQAAISMENAWLLSKEHDARAAAEHAAEREQAARAEAEEAVRLRDEFLSTASHELRTPVTSLQLVVQSLMRGLRESKPSVPLDMLAVASRQSDRLVALINQLLDVARIESGQLDLRFEEFDLALDAARIVERLQPQIGPAKSPVRLHAKGPVTGRWDRSRIDQLLTNLLMNALTYGAGQPIDLTLECDRERDRARIVVRDQGIGIPPARLSRIFDRFERASSTRHHGGLGLGLYIAREIAEAHGGAISVESEVGHGSSFLVDLPRNRPNGEA